MRGIKTGWKAKPLTQLTGQFNILPGRLVKAIKRFWCLTPNSHHNTLLPPHTWTHWERKGRGGGGCFHTLAAAKGFPSLPPNRDCWMTPNRSPCSPWNAKHLPSSLPDSPSALILLLTPWQHCLSCSQKHQILVWDERELPPHSLLSSSHLCLLTYSFTYFLVSS